MEEKNGFSEGVEIDVYKLFTALLRRAWIIIIVAAVCASAAFLGTVHLITPLYQSSAMFYVNNNSLSVGDASLSISSSDITASKSLVETYIVILKSRTCLNDVIDYAGVDYSYSELRGMISASSVNSTEVFEVVVTSPDPAEAENIANAIAYILPNRISDIVDSTSAKIVDYAVRPSAPSSPDLAMNTILGFVIGFALSAVVIIIITLLDVTIRSEEDVESISKHPILSTVPDMMAPSKGGYYYGYGKKKEKRKKTPHSHTEKNTVLVGEGISFAASEAYKLLRTKIQFSFADDNKNRIIGVSSALTGEGKSLSSVNIAYSLNQLDKKVLLIDCDMRRPSIAEKLGVPKSPGLSEYLTGNIALEDAICSCGKKLGKADFNVVVAGRNPPNPIELLSSSRMEEMLKTLRDAYDYIILDLPPVGEVSDAMVASRMADGVLLVVCQNYCTRTALSRAIGQFEFVGARILGIVVNRVTDSGRRYGKYGKKYYRYGYGYGKPSDKRHI